MFVGNNTSSSTSWVDATGGDGNGRTIHEDNLNRGKKIFLTFLHNKSLFIMKLVFHWLFCINHFFKVF